MDPNALRKAGYSSWHKRDKVQYDKMDALNLLSEWRGPEEERCSKRSKHQQQELARSRRAQNEKHIHRAKALDEATRNCKSACAAKKMRCGGTPMNKVSFTPRLITTHLIHASRTHTIAGA